MSPEYSTWLNVNGLSIRFRRYPPIQTPVAVLITVLGGKGFTRSRDIDNTIKAVLDLLRKAQVIPDDSVLHVPDVCAVYVERPNTLVAECVVRVSTIGADDDEEGTDCGHLNHPTRTDAADRTQ